jgi:hypothetical protein
MSLWVCRCEISGCHIQRRNCLVISEDCYGGLYGRGVYRLHDCFWVLHVEHGTVTNEEVAKIAKAHGWEPYHNVSYQPSCYNDGDGLNVLAYLSGDSWVLTDAGAFRVMVESKLELENPGFAGEEDAGWECSWLTRDSIGTTYRLDAHEAVAAAELARLEARGE